MAVLSGLHRRIQQQAFAKEVVAMGMRVVGSEPTLEAPLSELHLNGAVVSCSFIPSAEVHSNAPSCPFEDQCDGNCFLLSEAQ